MRTPCITQIPGPILVEVVYFYLAVHRAGCKAISIGVECCRLDHVLVSILEQREAFLLRLMKIVLHCWNIIE